MVHAKSVAYILLAVLTPLGSNAFTVISSSPSHAKLTLSATSRADDGGANPSKSANSLGNIAAVSAIALGLLFPSTDALAAQQIVPRYNLDEHAILSSTLDVSKVITTMDFSLPSSYDKISDPVVSAKDELTATVVVQTGSKRTASSSESPSPKKKSAPSKSVGLPTSSFSSGTSLKEEAAAALAERIAQRKSQEAEQAARDEQLAKEREANIKAAREEKIARRAAEQAEKEAAALAKEEETKYAGVKFVDTSMPKY